MATQKLNVKDTIIAGAQYGMKNILNLILMVVLYVLTAWIPYFNIGTTVGLYKAIIKIGRGEMIKPTDIWAKGNWDNLGDLFLLLGLMSMGISAAALFMFIPAMVVGIAWGFAVFFFIDRGISPTKALKLSWKATDGEKWKIFFVQVRNGMALPCGNVLVVRIVVMVVANL